jgi:hypothetical protein
MLEKQFPGVVKVLPARKDFGPATKLLPTLEVETDPETIIITVDVSQLGPAADAAAFAMYS